MIRYEFRAITAADSHAMAELLLSRQLRERNLFPFLENRCVNLQYCVDVLDKAFANDRVIGAGAFANNEPVGYIMGEIKADPLRSKHVWVPYEGIAVREDQPPELIRQLYAKVADSWLKQGCFMHYAIIPLGNKAYFEAVEHLSFFIQQVHGVMSTQEYRPFAQVSGAKVRIAGKADREKMGRLSGVIQLYQNATPTFELVLPEIAADIKAGYENTVEDGDMTVLLAEQDGEALGFQMYAAADPCLMSPDDSAELNVAGTYEGQMGAGVGKKLMNEGCALMKERGVRHIITDWRVTNLASSTFWPKCGFEPVAYRMVRVIDSNWTRASLD